MTFRLRADRRQTPDRRLVERGGRRVVDRSDDRLNSSLIALEQRRIDHRQPDVKR